MAGVRKVKIVVEVPIEIGNDDGFYCGEGCRYLINFERCAVCGLFNVPLKKKLFIFRCGQCMKATKQAQIHKCQAQTLGYLQAHFDAERRIKRGERQVFCKTCQKWQWPDELCEYAEVE